MKKILFTIFALAFFNINTEAQTHYNGFVTDNYSASFGSLLQPASLVDNRFKWSVGAGGNYTYSNNYIGQNIKVSRREG